MYSRKALELSSYIPALQNGIVSLAPFFDELFSGEYFTFAIGNDLAKIMLDDVKLEKPTFTSLYPKLDCLHLMKQSKYRTHYCDWRTYLSCEDIEQKIL